VVTICSFSPQLLDCLGLLGGHIAEAIEGGHATLQEVQRIGNKGGSSLIMFAGRPWANIT
jgi:hypothetical protein